MTLPSKRSLWADLMCALDELERPPHEKHRRFPGVLDLPDAADLDARSNDELLERLNQLGVPALEYFKALARAETRMAHEAIENGLKAILLDGGLSSICVRSRRHKLPLLLEDVRKHVPAAFGDLERCFDSIIQYLAVVTGRQHATNIIDYFHEYGTEAVFVASRYASLEGGAKDGMMGVVYGEIIRALSILILGGTPKDVGCRIEEAARSAVVVESRPDPAWDAEAWLSEGPVRPRLEVIEDLNDNKWLLAALRRCSKESKDRCVRGWAQRLRDKCAIARKKERTDRQS